MENSKRTILTTLFAVAMILILALCLFYWFNTRHGQIQGQNTQKEVINVPQVEDGKAQEGLIQTTEDRYIFNNENAGVYFELEKNWDQLQWNFDQFTSNPNELFVLSIDDPKYGPEQGSEAISPNALVWRLSLFQPGDVQYEEMRKMALGEYVEQVDLEVRDPESGYPNYFLEKKEGIAVNAHSGYRYSFVTKTEKSTTMPGPWHRVEEFILLDDGRIAHAVALIGWGKMHDAHLDAVKKLLSKVEFIPAKTSQ